MGMYCGDWVCHKRHGKGTYFHINGTVKFQGDFADNFMEGKNVIYYDNGNARYAGEIKKDVADGTGTFFFKNGIKNWSGCFWKGMKHGRVTQFDKKGLFMMEGIYYEDKLVENEHDVEADRIKALVKLHLGQEKELTKQIQTCSVEIDVIEGQDSHLIKGSARRFK